MPVKKVLIVDDSKTELMFLSDLLQKNGMTVKTAEGADEAMRRLAEEKPDLIVMDVVMLAWFFLTPVFYSANMLPVSYTVAGFTVDIQRLVYILNPIASLVNMYRDLLYWGYRTDLDFFLRTFLTSVVVLVAGYWIFVRHSANFSEEV